MGEIKANSSPMRCAGSSYVRMKHHGTSFSGLLLADRNGTEHPMRLRLLIVSLGCATSLAVVLPISGCKQTPAASITEVNGSTSSPPSRPIRSRTRASRTSFDRVRLYVKVHDTAEARVPSLRTPQHPRQLSEREKALADEIRSGTRRGPTGARCFRLPPPRRLPTTVANGFHGAATQGPAEPSRRRSR